MSVRLGSTYSEELKMANGVPHDCISQIIYFTSLFDQKVMPDLEVAFSVTTSPPHFDFLSIAPSIQQSWQLSYRFQKLKLNLPLQISFDPFKFSQFSLRRSEFSITQFMSSTYPYFCILPQLFFNKYFFYVDLHSHSYPK